MDSAKILNKDNYNEIIYYIILSLYIIIGVANNSLLIGENKYITNPEIFYNIKIYVFPAVLLVFFLCGKIHDKIEYIVGLLFFAVTTIITIKSDTYHIVALAGFIICAYAYVKNPKRLAKVAAISLLIITLVIYRASQTGLIYDAILVERFGRTSHSFGFYYYTFLPTNILFFWIMFTYSRKKKASWIELILFAYLSYVIFDNTTHRLGFYLSIIVVVLYIIIVKTEIIKINNKFIGSLAIIGFTISALFTILTSYFYRADRALLVKLDSILNSRTLLGRTAFDRYNVKLFGQKIILHENGEYFLLDSGFLQTLIVYGSILFIIVLAMYTYIHWKSCKINDTMLFVWVTAQMIYTIVNDVWISVETGTCLLVAAVLLKQEYDNYKMRRLQTNAENNKIINKSDI